MGLDYWAQLEERRGVRPTATSILTSVDCIVLVVAALEQRAQRTALPMCRDELVALSCQTSAWQLCPVWSPDNGLNGL